MMMIGLSLLCVIGTLLNRRLEDGYQEPIGWFFALFFLVLAFILR